MILPTIGKEEAQKFSKVWKYNGLEIPLENVHFQFAADFCTVVLRSFVEQCLQKPAPPPPAPKIVEG